jgi:hypothetical protein
VAPGGCPPGAPTDPYVHTLEHTVPQAMGSLRDGRRRHVPYVGETARLANSAIRCGFGNTFIESQSTRRRSPQRFHVPMPRFPRRGPLGRLFPRFVGTIEALRLPAAPPTALRFLRLAVPRVHAWFRSGRHGVLRRQAWGWWPGIPSRELFRGDDRISQVPGEPPFPFAHVLRPRPAETSLTLTERSRGPR